MNKSIYTGWKIYGRTKEWPRSFYARASSLPCPWLGVWLYLFPGGSRDRPIDSVAVLPFLNVDSDPNSEYLSDGITESLISTLSQLSNPRVMARGTVFSYKGAAGRPAKKRA